MPLLSLYPFALHCSRLSNRRPRNATNPRNAWKHFQDCNRKEFRGRERLKDFENKKRLEWPVSVGAAAEGFIKEAPLLAVDVVAWLQRRHGAIEPWRKKRKNSAPPLSQCWNALTLRVWIWLWWYPQRGSLCSSSSLCLTPQWRRIRASTAKIDRSWRFFPFNVSFNRIPFVITSSIPIQ